MARLFAAFSSGLLLLFACTDPLAAPFEPNDPEAQHAYFPLQIGKYVEYQVDSVVCDFGPGGETLRDSSRTLIREQITDTLRDNTGQLVFVVERSERNSDTLPWVLRRVWSAARTHTQAIRSEDNLRFLRLVFPIERRTRWDGNIWIDTYQEIEVAGERIRPFVNWSYRVDSLDVPARIGSFVFDSTLVVTEVDETNAIERRLSRAGYTKKIGLVWREQWILDSQYCNSAPAPADCLTKPWEQKAQKGYFLLQVLTGHN
ncbi:MAG: hypothetical protein IPM98_03380 [Lewinellaceae bacterium]|nr:hypothetical protein [Lewinellaceae bacterium]